MKIKIHRLDLEDAANLNEARKDIRQKFSCIKAGSLKQRDITLSWKEGDEYLTLSSKDIS